MRENKVGLTKARLGFRYFNTAKDELSFKRPDYAFVIHMLQRAEELLTEALNYELPQNVRKYVEQTLMEISQVSSGLCVSA
ncbi:MAG: hypothetical protein GXO39_04740 [Thermotogae bacterium]|nr:hypothetical protein [Thermotogota bacterium]